MAENAIGGKTLEEKIREIEERLALEKVEIKGALELRQIKRDFEQATEHKGMETAKLEIYERLRSRVRELREQGVEDDTIRRIYKLLDREFEFDRGE